MLSQHMPVKTPVALGLQPLDSGDISDVSMMSRGSSPTPYRKSPLLQGKFPAFADDSRFPGSIKSPMTGSRSASPAPSRSPGSARQAPSEAPPAHGSVEWVARLVEASGQSEAARIFRAEGIDAAFAREELLGPDARSELKFLGLTAKDAISVAKCLKLNAAHLADAEVVDAAPPAAYDAQPTVEPEGERGLKRELGDVLAAAAAGEPALADLDACTQSNDSGEEVEQAPRRLRTIASLPRDPGFQQARGSILLSGRPGQRNLLGGLNSLEGVDEESEVESDTDSCDSRDVSPAPWQSIRGAPPKNWSRDASVSARSLTSGMSMSSYQAEMPAAEGKASLHQRLLGFLTELTAEEQGKKPFTGVADPERWNSYQEKWEDLKTLFPLRQRTMHRLQGDAEKFTYNPKYTNDYGYPTNQNINSSEFSQLFENINLNNIGSPYNLSEMGCIRNTRDYEREVLDKVALATGAHPDNVTGYIAHGGTEAALYGVWNGRQRLACGVRDLKDYPVMFYSGECHYSCAKIANLLGLESEKIAGDADGSINLVNLRAAILRNPGRSIIVMATVGTTFLESVDDVASIKEILEKNGTQHWIHVDAAYLGMVLPFIKDTQNPRLKHWAWDGGADSISISGHKFCGTNVPCGMGLVRKPEDGRMAGMGQQEYVDVCDNTISGCRNGNVVLELWLTFQRFWREGFEYLVEESGGRAEYIYQRLEAAGMNPWRFDKQSLTIVFDRPANQELCNYYHLMCRGSQCHVMAHNTDQNGIDIIISAIQASKAGRWTPPTFGN